MKTEIISLTKKGYKNRNTARVSACRYVKKYGLENVTKKYIEKDGKIFVDLIVGDVKSLTAKVSETDQTSSKNDEGVYEIDQDSVNPEVLRPVMEFISSITTMMDNCGPEPVDTDYSSDDEWQKWARDVHESFQYYIDDCGGEGDILEVVDSLKKIFPNWHDKNNLIPEYGNEIICERDQIKSDMYYGQEKDLALLRTLNENCASDSDINYFGYSECELVEIQQRQERLEQEMRDANVPF